MPSKNDQTSFPLTQLQAGIKRDGTPLDGNFYTDGLWCRFRNARPKKIGGYREIMNLNAATVGTNPPTTPIREVYPIAASPLYLLHAFHGNGITGMAIDQNGLGGSTFDRTPAGFVAGDKYTWSVDTMYDATGLDASIVAHAAPDLADIASDVAAKVYYGIGNDPASPPNPLADTGAPQVSGGCCVIGQFLFTYGSNGLIQNSDVNKPTVWSGGFANAANPVGTKVVKGLPLRGGAAAPAGLFWALDSLVRVSFIGGTAFWRYDPLGESSILSKNSAIEYDGIYYWIAADCFMSYDGVIKELPNPMNQDFFFDNVNMSQLGKVWATKVKRYGEIWWFFPRGSATECNWAVIYNIREKSWYDTPILRSCGHHARELKFPVWANSASNTDGGSVGYRVYRHEFGVDAIENQQQVAIRSYFETPDLGIATGVAAVDQPENPNVTTRLTRIEPDLRQVGKMTVTVRGQQYAQGPAQADSTPLDILPGQGTVDPREQRRLLTLRFESNVQGGNYHAGKTLVHLEQGDARP